MLRYYSILLVLIIILFSCANNSNNNKQENSINDSASKIDNSSEFLNLFKTINPQGLHIYTIVRDKNGNIIKSPFIGQKIDVNKFHYTDDSLIFINIRACRENTSNIFAVYKFDINQTFTGLITRQFSQYDETLIQLLLWDKNTKVVKPGIDLADAFGDEGWFFDKESWITKFSYNSDFSIVSRKKDFIGEDIDENNRKTPEIITDTLTTAVFHEGKFITSASGKLNKNDFILTNWESLK